MHGRLRIYDELCCDSELLLAPNLTIFLIQVQTGWNYNCVVCYADNGQYHNRMIVNGQIIQSARGAI